jgi:NAD(P)-dependent dehydrogenase (short-subunit alcohol dehydrogenase family)
MGAVFLPLDVTSEENWKAALSAVLEKTKRLDILVNNAGINIRKNIEEMPAESFDAMIAVNVKGPFLGIKHCLPIMRAAGGGVILNMSSICGLVGHKYTNEAYTTTKGALTMLTKSVAVRYAKDNIRCNSVHPSTVETPLVQAMLKDPERRAERLGEVPLGRLANVADVANALVYLASDEAAFINGVAFPVDGGLTAG